MKAESAGKTERNKRTTISLEFSIWRVAQANMKQRGFNHNFSAYVADLVRRDAEKIRIAALMKLQAGQLLQ